VGEATRNIVQVGTVGAYNDGGPHGDVIPHGEKAQRREGIIYDTLEALPPATEEPVSESESDTDESDESGETDDNESNIHDDGGRIRESTIESKPFVSAPSSPKDPDPEIKTQRIWKPKPAPFDPGSYISAVHEKAQSHLSYAYETDTTMRSEIWSRKIIKMPLMSRYTGNNGSWRSRRNIIP